MLTMPIDAQTAFLAGSLPEALVDYETKEPKLDRDGKQVYRLQLIARGSERSELFFVKTSTEPKNVFVHEPVKVTGLAIQVWTMEGKTGVSFVAERVEPVARKTAA
jgi:hypothetical protein